MSETKLFTYQDVAEHNTNKDMFCVVHDKVYDCTKFLDEHPGGEEVMLDVAGQDATEAFEDVGHSDEAREALDKLYVGDLKRVDGDPAPKSAGGTATAYGSVTKAESSGPGIGLYAIVMVGGLLGYLGYQYLQNQQQSQPVA